MVENYPDLKANQNVLQLQEELTNTENLIAFARQHYNDVIGQYDTRRESFPTNLIASRFGFQPREYFRAPDEERAVPKVDLSGIGTRGQAAGVARTIVVRHGWTPGRCRADRGRQGHGPGNARTP